MERILNMAVCEGRHNIPQATDGAIFDRQLTAEQIKDVQYLYDIAYWNIWVACLPHYKNNETGWLKPSEFDADVLLVCEGVQLNLYVTGLTVAVIAAIKAAKSHGINVTLWHYDKDNDNYYSQEV